MSLGDHTSSSNSLETLPVDAIISIFRKLTVEELLVTGSTCRALNAIANSDELWMERCHRWKDEVEVAEWRTHADSAKALFRVLRAFSDLVGLWSAKELTPRGALLYITWENFSLLACRVIPHSFGNVKFSQFFRVIGVQDRSMKLQLLALSRTNGPISYVHMPGSLVWLTSSKSKFHLESVHSNQSHCLEQSTSNGHLNNNGHRALQYLVELPFITRNGSIMPLGQGYISADIGARSTVLQTVYSKLQVDAAKPGQDLSGLWSGIYGPHGLEVVSVSYNDNEIVATKVLGDPNVPCKQITFKVGIATQSAEVTPEIQQLASLFMASSDGTVAEIVKTYKGHGRIAEHGFKNPRWVTGQLLVDRNGAISFLWEDVNFVIQFRRLDLPALYESQKYDLSSDDIQQP